MATFTVNDSSSSWNVKGIQSYRIYNSGVTSADANGIVVEGTNANSEPVEASVSGSFYAVAGNAYGTITSIRIKINGSTAISATGLDVSLSSFSDLDSDTFARDATKGNDLFTVNSGVGSFWDLGAGNDTINSGHGNDFIDGGSGTDTYIANGMQRDYLVQKSSYGIQLTGANGETDNLRKVEWVRFEDGTLKIKNGSRYDDRISLADSKTSYLTVVGDGNDNVQGSKVRDLVFGGDGADSLRGNDGYDRLFGGKGNDRIEGGNQHDRLFGGGGNDQLRGGNGNDILRGSYGKDKLVGGTGNDQLYGDNGNDKLLGHKGDDQLTGGKHADVFVFHKGHGNDTITDFTVGVDHIEIGRGASRLKQLEFSQQGDDVLIAFADVTILVEDTTVTQMQDADNFLF